MPATVTAWFKHSDDAALAQAIGRSHAIVEVLPDGKVATANQNFLDAMGYALVDVRGKHHSMFGMHAERDGDSYEAFWERLRQGECQAGIYQRVGRDGRKVWTQSTYTPILGRNGRLIKVIEVSADITQANHAARETAGTLAAINRAQAMIEFSLDGTVITANDNFLSAMGYTLAEIQGRHHAMFVDAAEQQSDAYREFWDGLNRGESKTAEYKRFGKNGRKVWILASYNPIFDDAGRPYKVVKLAADITSQKLRNADFEGQIAAIGKSQAVIEFDMTGTIQNANENFLEAVGYSLDEIRGKHHSIFVEPADRDDPTYRAFWDNLRLGIYQAGEFKRVAKGNREIYIQASYNPILDLDGRPFKVVKYASDTTAQVVARMRSAQVCTMMNAVAAGAEELNSSVREISEAMAKSRDTTLTAVDSVDIADRQAQRLSTASQSMNGIVELIANITGQINLLALNATIESARAGEAGRGFAVVASEVKNLATQARQAADRISKEIDAMTGISGDVLDSLSSIKKSIGLVSEYVTSTAAAVEEQTAVTGEMSASMHRAAAQAAAIGR